MLLCIVLHVFWVTFLCFFVDWLFLICVFFFFSSRRRHTRCLSDWSSDVCSSDLVMAGQTMAGTRSARSTQCCRKKLSRNVKKEIVVSGAIHEKRSSVSMRTT